MRCESDSCCRALPITAVLAVIGVCAAGTVAWYFRQSPTPTSPQPVCIVISGDTAGWIVPCGCTANQSGGLPRRGTLLRRERYSVNVYADAGGAPAGTSDYHRVKFEAILAGELAMGLVAHNLGGPECALGPEYLRHLVRRLNVPFVSANLRNEAGELIGWPIRIVQAGGRRIAFCGVLSRHYTRPGAQIDDAREAVLTAIANRKGEYDTLAVLAYMPEDELRAFAASLPEADFVIGGPTGQSIAPESAGATFVAAATNKGKFLVRLESGAGPWIGSVVELDKSFADDPDQIANVRSYLADLSRRDFTAAETGFVAPLPPGLPADYRIAGSDSCKNCHQAECQSWAASKHAHAWDTLVAKGYQVDGYCQQCHTTGFGLPGGFESANRSPDRLGVGCESCHGPAEAHVKNPKLRTPFAARDQCVRCHDHENSPAFAYDVYWEKVRHGKR